ncbi:phosphotransferase family protein [Ekhidna sp.]|uniref:phosphotransferase family protein n=1 Tax=Ekhidna sp. TaxID=2608089 RepID=UPI003C7D5C1B
MEKEQRPGEELDMDRLLPWINEHVQGLEGNPKVTQFSGGASNWTYRLQFENQDLILRRAPLGKKAAGAHNMPREYYLQKKLKPHYSYVPEMIAVCENEEVLGSTFYLMERLEGMIPRKNLPREVEWNSAMVKNLCRSFWDKMIELHQVDYQKHGLDDLGKGEGYVERQVNGWNKRFADAKTWNVPSGKKVMKWLEQNMPEEENLCVIHNDFRLDNVVLDLTDPSNIIGVLDWELAAIGDPLMDLGSSLAYWVHEDDNFFIKSMRRQPSNALGMMKRQEIIDYYAEKTGRTIEDFRFYRVYGLFRLAGIAQQIYYRYSKGFTKNKAFKNFWMISIYLIKTCENVMKQKR